MSEKDFNELSPEQIADNIIEQMEGLTLDEMLKVIKLTRTIIEFKKAADLDVVYDEITAN